MSKSAKDNRLAPTSKFVYGLVHLILQPLRIFLFKIPKTEMLTFPEGPCFVLTNHASFFDPLIVIALSKEPVGFVAGEHLFASAFNNWFLTKTMGSLPCEKGYSSARALRDIRSKIQEGQKICIFGEGNITYDGVTEPLSVSTGKLARMLKCNVVTLRLQGAYPLRPRWSKGFHANRVHCDLMHVYSREALAAMKPQEVTRMFNADIFVQEPVGAAETVFHCTAEGISHVLYACPKCKNLDTIRSGLGSKKREISCVSCGAKGIWNTSGKIESADFTYETLYDWHAWQSGYVQSLTELAESPTLRHEGVNLTAITPATHKRELLESDVVLKLNKDRLKVGERTFALENIAYADTRDKGILLFSATDGGYYEITSKKGYPGLLYKTLLLSFKERKRLQKH